MTGVIVINKPQEFTSFDVVAITRGVAKTKKVGHTGTLDPMATGVLPILVGRATKAADLLPDTSKAYEASFKVGIKTDTGDIWGNIKEENDNFITKEQIENTLDNFRGNIFQIPPMYSAVSVGGTRLYKLARQGIEIEREKKSIKIDKLELLEFDGIYGKFLIECSKGTYIRTLIEDIAESVGVIATMTALVRTKACGFSLEDAISIEKLREIGDMGTISDYIKPVETLFETYQNINITEAQKNRFTNGGELDINRVGELSSETKIGDIYKIFCNGFLGLGMVKENGLKMLKGFIEV